MKNTFYSVITLVVLLSSCTKEDYGQYHEVPENPTDTLVFIQEHMYSYNGQIYTYGLYSSGNVWKLDLYDSMRFGYISGSIPGSFMQLGEFYLKKFYYNDIGMTGHVFITMIKVS